MAFTSSLRLACGTAGEIGLHVGSYHVPTGTVAAPPCEVLLRTYQVVVKGDEAVKRTFVGECHSDDSSYWLKSNLKSRSKKLGFRSKELGWSVVGA
jgi:hypothetical protein